VGVAAAKAFVRAGWEVVGYARRAEVVEAFKAVGGRSAASPGEVAGQVEIVLVLVLNDAQVIEVITGPNGVLQGAKKGSTVIGMSTINRENQERMARECGEKEIAFMDCPFTGGPARAEKGTLTLIAAGPESLVESVRPALEVIGKIVHVGETPGMGQSVKHCNQLLVSVTHAAVMETIQMARKLNLDPRLVCEIVGSGIGGSDYFRLLSKSVLDGDPAPGGLGQLAKDIGIVINTARGLQMPLYVATSTFQYFQAALAQGLEKADGGDLIKVLERMTERAR
jgi:3-hydroxyisobutyrate dehydrogenase